MPANLSRIIDEIAPIIGTLIAFAMVIAALSV